MGAGISKEQERAAQYRGLQRVLRQLRKSGIECQYGNKAVTGSGFRVSYGPTLRASNGETFLNMYVEVDGEDYWLLDVPKGIARIKAMYGNERDRLAVTGLAWLIVQIENAVREGCRVENMGKPEWDVFSPQPGWQPIPDSAELRHGTRPGLRLQRNARRPANDSHWPKQSVYRAIARHERAMGRRQAHRGAESMNAAPHGLSDDLTQRGDRHG